MSSHATSSLRHSAFVRYAIPFASVIGAALITRSLQSVSPRVPGSLIFCAAIFSGWFGGIGPALVAAIISSVAIFSNFVPPPYPVESVAATLPRLVVYSVAVFFVAWISGRQRWAEELLERTRAQLEEKIQERTAELRRINAELQEEIAERKVAETEQQALQAELAHVSRVTMMGELTASIAHEVNQPLGAIMNYANACRRLLASGQGEMASIDEALAKIVDDAHRASSVIARIRALSKKKPTEKSPSSVEEVIYDVVAIAKFEAQARGVTMRVDLANELPLLQVDRIQLQQVLLNLIMNGMEAMESVAPNDRRIAIRARADHSADAPTCVIQVQDYGIGIAAAADGRLFEPFYSTKSKGLGLGLAISRSIVEAHGGRLTLAPTGGAGATFQIQLPTIEGANS